MFRVDSACASLQETHTRTLHNTELFIAAIRCHGHTGTWSQNYLFLDKPNFRGKKHRIESNQTATLSVQLLVGSQSTFAAKSIMSSERQAIGRATATRGKKATRNKRLKTKLEAVRVRRTARTRRTLHADSNAFRYDEYGLHLKSTFLTRTPVCGPLTSRKTTFIYSRTRRTEKQTNIAYPTALR